jgi:hypothetical protein
VQVDVAGLVDVVQVPDNHAGVLLHVGEVAVAGYPGWVRGVVGASRSCCHTSWSTNLTGSGPGRSWSWSSKAASASCSTWLIG